VSTIFLAKFLGLYCIVVAMMTRKRGAVATVKALIGNPPLLLFAEVVGLAGGLAMIIGHNIWSGGALRHSVGMAHSNPQRRAPRFVAGCGKRALRCLAI